MLSANNALEAPMATSQLDSEVSEDFPVISSIESSVEAPDETNHPELIEALNKLVEEIKFNNDRPEKRGFLW